MTAEHYTAWLTIDPTALDQDRADVIVLADHNTGEDDAPRWESVGDPLMQAATTVPAEGGDHGQAKAEAEKLLDARGWQVVGEWEHVSTGYVVTVERVAG